MINKKYNDYAHEIIPNLWLGNKEAAKDLKFLTKNKIGLVVNCSKEQDIKNFFENRKDINIQYIRIPVDDSLQKKDFAIMTNNLYIVVPIIENFLKNNIPVFVHCFAGMQRSATVVASYLLYKFHIPLYQAIYYIQKKRNIAFTPQINFIDSLLLYYYDLLKKRKSNKIIK
jgi:protein-tyrosine phosphatase